MTAGSAPGYYINVGLFADESQCTQAQSRAAGTRGCLYVSPDAGRRPGTCVRVRVNYASRSQAGPLPPPVKALGLKLWCSASNAATEKTSIDKISLCQLPNSSQRLLLI